MLTPDDDELDDESPSEGPVGRPAPGDDFFCLRYRVWYPSYDCAIRTQFRTSEGCVRCDQGRFNLKRHAAAVRAVRWRRIVGE
jgi:hypothetical protein